MRILHLLKSKKYSGAENVVCQIIEGFSEKEKYDMAYCSTDGEIRGILDEKGIRFYGLDKLSMSEINKVIDEYKPDVIHAHGFSASVFASIVAPKQCKVISHLHSNPIWFKHLNARTIAYYVASKRFDDILVVSNSVVSEYVFGNKIHNKTIMVGNPFDASDVKKKAEEALVNVASDVAFLGRLTSLKNPLLFIDIIDKVKEVKTDIKAVMIGNGELEEECKKIINERNLQNNICMLGFQKNPYVYVKNTKLLCMPSSWEGFGLAALEAMALGKPVIGACVGGLKEIIDENCGGFAKDIEEYATKIVSLLNDTRLYEKMSAKAIRQADQYSNKDEYINVIQEIYEGIMAGEK